MFVKDETVDVTDDDGNTVVIRARMNFKIRQRVVGVIAKVGDKEDVSIDLGAYNLALLQHNITAWRGPAFEGVACTPENIEQLDPDEPLVNKVLEEINNRNKPKQSPNPK